MYLQLGNGVTTSYTYRQDNRRLDALQAQLPNVTHYQFQNLGYRYDNVGNILGIANNSLYPKGQQGIGEEVGGPVTQSYIYDDLYRLKEASGEYRHEADELRRYRMGMDYDSNPQRKGRCAAAGHPPAYSLRVQHRGQGTAGRTPQIHFNHLLLH